VRSNAVRREVAYHAVHTRRRRSCPRRMTFSAQSRQAHDELRAAAAFTIANEHRAAVRASYPTYDRKAQAGALTLAVSAKESIEHTRLRIGGDGFAVVRHDELRFGTRTHANAHD